MNCINQLERDSKNLNTDQKMLEFLFCHVQFYSYEKIPSPNQTSIEFSQNLVEIHASFTENSTRIKAILSQITVEFDREVNIEKIDSPNQMDFAVSLEHQSVDE